jgi:5,10-methylenetetrahydromethanopterin reductase
VSRPRELSIALQSDKRPAEYAALGRLVEELGFGTLSIYSDLYYQPPILPLAVVAQATTRLRLGPAALNPYTLHPIEIAGQLATLDLLSGGRAYLGLARGAWLDELGLEQRDPVGRLTEALDVIERLLAGDRRGYAGRWFALPPGRALAYAPLRPRLPLLLGGWGPRLLALAGVRADEVKVGGSANPALAPVVRERVAAGARPAGRDPDAVGVCFGAVSVVDEDRALARQLARREVAPYLAVVGALDPTVALDPELLARLAAALAAGDLDGAAALVSDELLDRFAFAGAPRELRAQCDALFAAGVTRVEFGTPHGVTPERGLRLLATLLEA